MDGNDVKFYKYLSPEASVSVLENRTLKWSLPKLFNDPFDFPTEIDFSFSGDELTKALMDELVKFAYGPEEPDGDVNNPLFAMSMVARHNPKNPSEEIFRKFMVPADIDCAEIYKKMQYEQRAFYKDFRDRFAVLCVSKKYNDLLMWAHYGKDHSGCVLKLRCIPERPLCMAKEVKYEPKYPLRGNLQDYVKHLTGQIELDYDNLFTVFAFTKSEHWAYEEEWRCISLLKDREAGFDYDPLIPEELEAVYLGCRSEEPFKNKIIDVIIKQFPDTHVYQTYADVQNYGLKFEQIR
jgi:hypothetical protein